MKIARGYAEIARRILQRADSDSTGYRRLAALCVLFGPRLSGSENLDAATRWILDRMREDGFANVQGEDVLVPHWVRGRESLTLLSPYGKQLSMLGLGGSVATPVGGIEADALVVGSFEELARRANEAAGKIVVYDVPYTTYGETVTYRWRGAMDAAKAGAVASLIRSVTPLSLSTPHTGSMGYADSLRKIPHAAITPEDAEALHRMQELGSPARLRLTMEASTLPDAPSLNVLGEIRGRETPDEVVVIGGHIDSWDVGQGAHDDAGGCVAAWEALRLLKELGLTPRRTVRVVMWTNEENGTRGGQGYAKAHADELEKHVLAIEADAGIFAPTGFGFSGSNEARALMRNVCALLAPISADTMGNSGGGVDISFIMKSGVPGAGLNVKGAKYFWYHHSPADTIDKIDARDFARCSAALAVLAYVVADLPERLPRERAK
jgi:carboxypeptidase Q